MLEVIATSVEDAILAEEGGADRLELISGMTEGGITPSPGLVEQVLRAVSIPVMVMIRPHAQHFRYSAADINVMLRDIEWVQQSGATGIVFGGIDEFGLPDRALIERVLERCRTLSLTFHRAFDEAPHLKAAFLRLASYSSINRVLTSGGQVTAIAGSTVLADLQSLSQSRQLTLLAGAGLSPDNVTAFIRDTGVRELHMGSSLRLDNSPLCTIDPSRVRQAAEAIRLALGTAP